MTKSLSGQKWKSLGSFVALNAGGMFLMIGFYTFGREYGLSAGLILSLAASLAALKMNIVDARTHFEAMLILASFYVAMLAASHSLDLGKLLALGCMTLLIILVGLRYREILIGR